MSQNYSVDEKHASLTLKSCPRCGGNVWTSVSDDPEPCDSCVEAILLETATKETSKTKKA